MGLPSTSVPSPGLPTSGLPNKQPPAPLSSPTPAQATATSVLQQPPSQPAPRKDKEGEKEQAPKGKGKGEPPPPPKKDRAEVPGPALPTALPALEYSVEPAQLQALQAALTSDPAALLTSQFLPYFVPGFSPYYAPQIPGALQSSYLQPLYGMEGLFPYGPALSQALLGLSSGSLLQHYQQYQQSLQEAVQGQQRQRQAQPPPQPPPPPKGSQAPVPTGTAIPDKDPAKEPPPQEEQKNAPREVSPHLPRPPEEPEAEGRGAAPALWDPFIVPKVQYKLVCRKCQAGFSTPEAASDHLKALCCFGQSAVNLQEMVLHVPAGAGGKGSGSYQCVACESTVSGDEALRQHLESAPHKHRTVPRAARNAKEPPSLLPHSACPPDPSTASTSQSAAHSKDSPSPPPAASSHAARKSWPPGVSRPPPRKPPPPLPPPLSSSSTVTSSSCSTSGVQPSMPTDDYLEESDSDLSQTSDGPASLAEGPEEAGGPQDPALASLERDTLRL